MYPSDITSKYTVYPFPDITGMIASLMNWAKESQYMYWDSNLPVNHTFTDDEGITAGFGVILSEENLKNLASNTIWKNTTPSPSWAIHCLYECNFGTSRLACAFLDMVQDTLCVYQGKHWEARMKEISQAMERLYV